MADRRRARRNPRKEDGRKGHGPHTNAPSTLTKEQAAARSESGCAGSRMRRKQDCRRDLKRGKRAALDIKPRRGGKGKRPFSETMADRVTKETRSRMMARVHGKNTQPEKYIRSMLFSKGYRFRLHNRDLPGSPDVILPRYGTVVFVHGCFWHGHDCARGRRPETNPSFWNAKLDGNQERDKRNISALEATGWRVFVIWTCELEKGLADLLGYLELLKSASNMRSAKRIRPGMPQRIALV